jgi:hypothetical protein
MNDESVISRNIEPLWGLTATFLHIGNVSLPPSGHWMLCVRGVVSEHCIAGVSSRVTSITVIVPSVGDYSITAFSQGISGFLETNEGVAVLTAESN